MYQYFYSFLRQTFWPGAKEIRRNLRGLELTQWLSRPELEAMQLKKIQKLLNTDNDLNFLLELQKKEIETLIACIRDRVEQIGR